MILLFGSLRDRVLTRVVEEVGRLGAPYGVVDEDEPGRYDVRLGDGAAVVTGGDCTGRREVTAAFVRHGVVRSPLPSRYERVHVFQRTLDRALVRADCLVVNRVHAALSNYSKPYQLRLLATAGFDTPRTLVTNDAARARAFAAEVGEVVVKGVSNSPTFARPLDPARLSDEAALRRAPAQFQERVRGVDHRVHVVGYEVFVTTLHSDDLDYRRAARANGEVSARPGRLPHDVVARCVAVTHGLGLVVSGIDLKESADGRIVALELNPYPQFTYYEGIAGQPISRAVAALLARPHDVASGLRG